MLRMTPVIGEDLEDVSRIGFAKRIEEKVDEKVNAVCPAAESRAELCPGPVSRTSRALNSFSCRMAISFCWTEPARGDN